MYMIRLQARDDGWYRLLQNIPLFGYEPEAVHQRYHQSLFEEIKTPLGFASGPITGRFGVKPTWHARKGLQKPSR
jgi:hypothetical protein